MRQRTLSRECALKILYQIDLTEDSLENAFDDFWLNQKQTEKNVMEFTEKLVRGVRANLKLIDDKISAYATNWQIDRMAVVDKNILRIGSFELLFLEEVPAKVAINEAVDLAKRYSGQEAGKFVNGILDKIKLERKFKD